MKRDKIQRKKLRQERGRNTIVGTPEKPRLCVFRSAKHIYAQIIDDVSRTTLVSASSKALKIAGGNAEAAKKVGEDLGSKAKEKGLTKVVFDRAGYLYHGRVAALADGAREKGLEF
jgi:large subunit ribosomal protein L18